MPVDSSTKTARATFGSTSGTATGSAPPMLSSPCTSTRACALMAGTVAIWKYQGRSDSVIFTSTIRAEHGGPPSE